MASTRSLALWSGRLAVATAAAVAVLGGCRDRDEITRETDRTCPQTQALSTTRYRGDTLPPKTLALTFDDGPGARTLQLSHWLAARHVPATFFVNGKMLRGSSGAAILADIVADGHVLGNHGESHADLTTLDAAAVVGEVTTTDALLAPFIADDRFLFRPPYNAFDNATYTALAASPMAKYVGPIEWDIGDRMSPQSAADWDCWQPIGTSDPPVLDPESCGDLFLAEIRAKQRGIVLLHDPYFIDDDPAKGGTVDMVQYIVPILLAEGYTFVAVDEVPAIAAALPPRKPSTNGGDAAPPPAAPTGSASSQPIAAPGAPPASPPPPCR